MHTNATLNNANDKVKEFHVEQFKAGYKFMVTAWSIDVTAHEIRNTLYQMGVPRPETNEFMEIIESYRDKVLAAA